MSEPMTVSAAIDDLRQALSGLSLEPGSATDMPTVYADRSQLIEICDRLRSDPSLQFSFLADVTAADYFPAAPRFEVVYHLACLGAAFTLDGHPPAPARRLRIKVRLAGDDAHIPSVSRIWPTAAWPEREVFDLFGITFDDHPDLRRILMPDDWEGFPLRKDYPVQVRRDTQTWSPVQLTPEEFAANVRAQRERAADAAHGGASAGGGRGPARE
jgi:NADH-quinone oxidoreductase subunit C